jgi:hypothetical protein
MSGEERRVLEEDGMYLQGIAQRGRIEALYLSKGWIRLERGGGWARLGLKAAAAVPMEPKLGPALKLERYRTHHSSPSAHPAREVASVKAAA